MATDTTERRPAPRLVANPVSLLGALVTTLGALAFFAFLGLEQFGLLHSPYAGLFGFVGVPAIFLLGLLLIPLGIWREAASRRHGHAAWRWPTIDFGQSRTRTIAITVIGLTMINVAIVGVAGYGAAHYSESNQFCGGICHVPMTPQFSAHARSAHAQVDCVACHVGPGMSGAVTAKMNGTRQLYEILTGTFNRPIPSPRDRMPVPAETCNRCHSPIDPDRQVTRVFREHKDNEGSTEILTTLLMYSGKNHWHARPDVVVEYVAEDTTLAKIPYVKVTRNGKAEEYFAEGVTSPPAGQPLRRMDCTDCHNRPAHTMAQTPAQVVDRAIARGEISTKVPFVRSEMVDALSEEHPAGVDASQAIAKRLAEKFGDSADAKQAVQVALRLYAENVYPEMRITWGTYTNQLFHIDDTGCFRCHDDAHKLKGDDSKAVRQDCELCHLEQ